LRSLTDSKDLPMKAPTHFHAVVAIALVMSGCASETKPLTTGALRPSKAPAQTSAAPVSPEDVKTAACLNRHVQYQKGEAAWGAQTLDAKRAADSYCQAVLGQ
jgi:hypothetical protein